MLSLPDFREKQILFVQSYAKKIKFRNGNAIFCDDDDKVISQASCYKLFCVFIVGETTLSSVVIRKILDFGITIMLMNKNLKVYAVIGSETEGNVLLRQKQYLMSAERKLLISKQLVITKVTNQIELLQQIRQKSDEAKDAIAGLKKLLKSVESALDQQSLLGIEGSAARIFFAPYFEPFKWYKRLPRTKCDHLNSLMDIGYTYLFNFVDAHLRLYGFDTYMGVYHQVFYQRKSLVCDHVEPFRCIIEKQILKAHNLGQIDEKDFLLTKGQYLLKYEHNQKYSKIFLEAIMSNKEEIFLYFQAYYRFVISDKETPPAFFIKK